MNSERPDPDALLTRVNAEEGSSRRGKLKIFFGAAPGVGKTYAMLEAARAKAKEGVDVVVGYVELHQRPETSALLLGMEILPRREIVHGKITLQEFDLAAALARKPGLILVDELAHTNAPSRTVLTHTKRWRDVVELLDAGIDVFTTLNVQHLESLNDVVARITGVRVRETVPDAIFDSADEVELVDLPPGELIERLQAGKVYILEQSKSAIEHFFQKGNLIALRELALRSTADRVDAQMRDYRTTHSIQTSWPTRERLLVCIGPSPSSGQLARATHRMAESLQAPWIAVHAETEADQRMSAADRDQLAANMNLVERLGGESATLAAADPVGAIVQFAREHNVTKIVAGKPRDPRWRTWFRLPFVYELARRSEDVDVYIISGADAQVAAAPRRSEPPESPASMIWALTTVAICTAVSWPLSEILQPTTLVMIYLLGVVAIAARLGRRAASLAAVLGVIAFDFFFVPPYYNFTVRDSEYIFTFIVMLFTGLMIGSLTSQVSFQAQSAQQRVRRTGILYAMSKELAVLRSQEEIVQTMIRHIVDSLDSEVAVVLADSNRKLHSIGERQIVDPNDWAVAQWVLDHGQRAGLGSDTLVGVDAMFFPMVSSGGCLGVIRVLPRDKERAGGSELARLLEAISSLAALAIERVDFVAAAEKARLEIESERLRNSLLSAVSHELRTPMASIVGSASTLLDAEPALDVATQRELQETILEEAERLNRLVTNLLDMTRLESGSLQLNTEWQSIEEVTGVVLRRLERQLKDHRIETRFPADLPLVPMDGLLIAQVLTNLLENARKYTPAGTTITIAAEAESWLRVKVIDQGRGLSAGEEERIFDRFYRSKQSRRADGVGLGLTICRGIIELHGGRIWAENRPEGGAAFCFELPIPAEPPLTIELGGGALPDEPMTTVKEENG